MTNILNNFTELLISKVEQNYPTVQISELDNLVHLETKTKRTPKLIEEERIKFICDSVNTDTIFGKELKEQYYNKFGKNILKFENNGGSLKDHYDFTIIHDDGTINRCEEKGTDTYLNDLSDYTIPWINSVQRYNGPGNQFSVGKKYAELWWKLVVSDENIKSEFNISENIPTLNEWLEKDAFQCGDPKTPYMKELKRLYREKYPGCSMNGKKLSPYDYRERVNSQFEFTDEDKEILIKESQLKLDQIMEEKQCWLQTSGVITEKLNFKWYNKIDSPNIIDINMNYSKGADLIFSFITDKSDKNFDCILRFGKGCGFSNIRFDIR